MRWEYTSVFVGYYASYMDELNKMGEQGWEAFQIDEVKEHVSVDHLVHGHVILFKRPAA